jgi:hypothetical protein
MTVNENGICTATQECVSGLECYEGRCIKPSYHFLGGPGALWGQECDPISGEPGCRCNHASKIFMYLKEASVTLPESLKNIYKDFENCMVLNGCTSVNEGYDSCMRKYCYTLYTNLYDTYIYSDPSLRPTHCGANGIVVMFLSMVVLMLL